MNKKAIALALLVAGILAWGAWAQARPEPESRLLCISAITATQDGESEPVQEGDDCPK